MNREQWTGFGFGVLAGALAGGVAALLLAPKSGKELRGQISQKSSDVFETGKEKIGEVRHKIGEKISGEECAKAAAMSNNGD
jgi:gas vesicle protein